MATGPTAREMPARLVAFGTLSTRAIARAHQPDEFISTGQLEAGTAFVRRLIRQLAA